MSLHNSTDIENQILDFSLISQTNVETIEKIVLQTKSKAQRSGFLFEEEIPTASEHSALKGMNAEHAGRGSTTVKLIRAQGECLGIRSR